MKIEMGVPSDLRQRVGARLAMAKVLIEFAEGLAGAERIRATREGGWNHVYGEYDALVTYLLLTCFDALGGQKEEWIDFSGWLRTSKRKECKEERERALKALPTNDPALAAANLFDAYNAVYGVTKGFYRFIDTMNGDAREALLRSIQVRRRDGDPVDDEEKVKKAFLFKTRNAFTHEAKAEGQSGRALGPEPIMLGPDGYKYGHGPIPRDDEYEYGVRRWPFVLYETVASAIGEPVPDFDLTFEVGVELGDKMIWIGPVPSKDLKDTDELRRLAKQHAVATP